MAAIPPVTVIAWPEFTENPSLMHDLFDKGDDDQLIFDTNKVLTLLLEDEDSRIFNVESEEEFFRLRDELMSKYVLLRIHVVHIQRTFVGVGTLTTTWNADFAALVNFSHPHLKPGIEARFLECVTALRSGEKYCLEFDLGPSIREWFSDMFKSDSSGCCSETDSKSKFTRIYLTNHSRYQHCFDCGPLWILGFLCWIATAPCYMLIRSRSCRDIIHSISSPVVLRTGLEDGTIGEYFASGSTNRTETEQLNQSKLLDETAQ